MNDNHIPSDDERQKPIVRLTPKRTIREMLLWIVMIGGATAFIGLLAFGLGSGQFNLGWLALTGIPASLAVIKLLEIHEWL